MALGHVFGIADVTVRVRTEYDTMRFLTCVISLATLTFPLSAGEPLITEAIIDAPRKEVWKAFTTKEGVESWMVAHAQIDLKVGGKWLIAADIDQSNRSTPSN